MPNIKLFVCYVTTVGRSLSHSICLFIFALETNKLLKRVFLGSIQVSCYKKIKEKKIASLFNGTTDTKRSHVPWSYSLIPAV